MIGTTLAHFKITGKLGEGGMGEVYRAEDSKLGREVAIKVLPPMVAADAERLARFEREAKLLASLNHPNIGAIYAIESAERDGSKAEALDEFAQPITAAGPAEEASSTVSFLVLELIEGDTLAEALANGPVGLEKALEIGHQMAVALEAAHAKGVIHRDLKPANVKLTPDGKVKVLDFGLAKAWEVEESSGSSPMISHSPTLTQGMTQAGMLLGTAAYMSPEQARGKPVDKRADIWSFGCVLLEMLTGRKVFGGDTVTDMIAAVVAREPEWERLPGDTPQALTRLLRRCIEKDPEKRLRDIGDARIELEELLARPAEELREPETVAVPSRASRLWQVAAVALAVATAGLGYALWRASSAPPEEVVRAFIPAPATGDFDLVTDYPAPVALSPDGRSLVYGIEESSGKRLWVRDLDDLEARPLNGTEGAIYPFWSPDSRYIGFFAQTKLKKIEATGGPVMTLCDAPNGKGGTWNEDGIIVFAPSHISNLQRVSAAGGEPVDITKVRPDQGEDSHRHPRFLPDGEHYLFVARSGFGGQSSNSRVLLGSLAGDEPSEVMAASSNVEYAAGHLLYVFERALMARPFDLERLEVTGDAFPIAENIYADLGAVLGVFSSSEKEVLVYQTGTQREDILSTFQWVDRSGEVLGDVGTAEPYGEVSLSPDGKTAVVNLSDPQSGNRDLWLVDLERELKTRFTFEESQDWIAAWSPDGNRIVFSSERGGSSDLYVKSIMGSGEAELLYDDEALKYPMSWSPDGRYVFFEWWGTDGGVDIKTYDLEANEPLDVVKTQFNERAPMISPDGRWLAYISDESGADELYVTAFPEGGRRWQVSTEGARLGRWVDSKEILVTSEDGVARIAEVDGSTDTFKVGRVEEFAHFDVISAGVDFDVAPDGQRFLTLDLQVPDDQPSQMDPVTLVLNWTRDLERP